MGESFKYRHSRDKKYEWEFTISNTCQQMPTLGWNKLFLEKYKSPTVTQEISLENFLHKPYHTFKYLMNSVS